MYGREVRRLQKRLWKSYEMGKKVVRRGDGIVRGGVVGRMGDRLWKGLGEWGG